MNKREILEIVKEALTNEYNPIMSKCRPIYDGIRNIELQDYIYKLEQRITALEKELCKETK
jgi:hypothetical protein